MITVLGSAIFFLLYIAKNRRCIDASDVTCSSTMSSIIPTTCGTLDIDPVCTTPGVARVARVLYLKPSLLEYRYLYICPRLIPLALRRRSIFPREFHVVNRLGLSLSPFDRSTHRAFNVPLAVSMLSLYILSR